MAAPGVVRSGSGIWLEGAAEIGQRESGNLLLDA